MPTPYPDSDLIQVIGEHDLTDTIESLRAICLRQWDEDEHCYREVWITGGSHGVLNLMGKLLLEVAPDRRFAAPPKAVQ